MNRIEKMLKDKCPNGVEYKSIGDIAIDIYRGAGIKQDEVVENGIPCVRYGEIYTTYGIWFDHCVSHTIEENIKSKKYFEYGDILFAITGESVEDIAKTCAYVGHERCLAGGDIVVLKHSENPKYLSYVLDSKFARKQKSRGKVKSKVVHSSVPDIKRIILPIPPIEVQDEIVRILDEYSNQNGLLISTIDNELAFRKTQYEYYREALLSPRNEWTSSSLLATLVQPITDGPHETPKLVDKGVPFISAEAVQNNTIHFELMRGYITEEYDEICCKKYKPQLGDIYMCKSGSTTGKIAMVETSQRFNIWSPLAAIRVNQKLVLPRFMFYFLQTKFVQKQVKAAASMGSQPNLSMRKLEQFVVCYPDLSEQERIINKIENLNNAFNDICEALVRERKLRLQQYVYYSGKLLSFSELSK